MATHSRILAWRIPWAEEPDGPQSMGSQESDTTAELALSYKAGSHAWPQKSGEAERTWGTVWMRREVYRSLERQKQHQKWFHLHPSWEHFGRVTVSCMFLAHLPSPALTHQPWEWKWHNSWSQPCSLNSVLMVFLFFIQVSACVSFLQLLELGQSRHDFQ